MKTGSVLLTGATGLVGGRLMAELSASNVFVRTLSRSGGAGEGTGEGKGRSKGLVEHAVWDGVDPGPDALAGIESIVHLAGEPIFGGLPSRARLERVRASRIDSTRRLVERILERPEGDRPRTFVCASAVGLYGDAGEAELDEEAPVGEGFLAEVCRDWEAATRPAEEAGLRVVRLRIGVVLAHEGGALALMRVPFSLGLGGRLGDGRQFFPWIQLDDLVRVIRFCLETPIEGAVNAVAPGAVRNADFTRVLARVLGRPAVVPVPGFAVRTALGEISGELLGSRKVVPAKLSAAGFEFRHRTVSEALEAELR